MRSLGLTAWVCLFVFGAAGAGEAGVVRVTEVLIGEAADATPPYVEVMSINDAETFDLVVLDVGTRGANEVISVTTLQQFSYHDTYVVHEGPWPHDRFPPEIMHEVSKLGLNSSGIGARAVLVYDHETDIVARSSAEVVTNAGGWADAFVYRTSEAEVVKAWRDQVIDMPDNGAYYRASVDGEGEIWGEIDENLEFDNGVQLDPALLNPHSLELSAVPEPGAGSILAVAALLLGGGRWRPQPSRRAAAR